MESQEKNGEEAANAEHNRLAEENKNAEYVDTGKQTHFVKHDDAPQPIRKRKLGGE
ncbi:MAG: hypothetical protein J6M62_10360 [Selenomonadaceae bacterium]|nr:hypothetical protein [Selenomonadaceae bacterium]